MGSINKKVIQLPTIETDRLRLSVYRQEDLETVYRLASDPVVARYFPDGPSVNRETVLASLPARLEYWERTGFGQFGVFLRDTGELIGYSGLKELETTGRIELYYGFFPDHWAEGYATESARATLRFGFEIARLEEIVAVAHVENLGSIRVLEKIGMTGTGEREHYGMACRTFRITKDEFQVTDGRFLLTYEER